MIGNCVATMLMAVMAAGMKRSMNALWRCHSDETPPNKSLNRSGVSGLGIRKTGMLFVVDRRPVNSTVIHRRYLKTGKSKEHVFSSRSSPRARRDTAIVKCSDSGRALW
jgi:hypothetical protein